MTEIQRTYLRRFRKCIQFFYHPEVQILYPVAMQMSMTSTARRGGIFWLRLCFFAFSASLLLSGCSTKSAEPPAAPPVFYSDKENNNDDRFVLPPDDGRPLSPSEETAFLSMGDFDTNLSMAERTEVLRHFKQLVHRERGTVKESVSRARLYMPYIRRILEERRLPRELAYLPFIESNYGVLVRSRSGALGMWQFMPGTATHYGMSRDMWTDERRDPYISTRAAATYFERLRDFFDGDWHLAISAYNAGEGKIRRGLDATGARTFFELRAKDDRISDPKLKMTNENRQYLPKFLAVCKIMRNLNLLGFESVEARPAPSMISVPLKPGTHLPSLASVTGMNWDNFQQYNAVFLRLYSPPGRYVAWVPLAKQSQAVAWLSNQRASDSYASWRPYTATSQDTLWRIAKRHGVTQTELCRVNGLSSNSFRSGITLLVPPKQARAERPAKNRRGRSNPDYEARLLAQRLTAQDISPRGAAPKATKRRNASNPEKSSKMTAPQRQQTNASAQALSRQNVALKNGSSRSSQTALSSRKQDSSRKNTASNPQQPKNTARPAKGGANVYKVQQGDTIWSIAKKHNLSPRQLLSANGMKVETANLHPGDTVRLR